MPITIEMPKLSDTMTEGTLVRWLKKVGDTVAVGDVIAEVETDKATMEMEAFDEGTLSEIFVNEGQKVEIGQRLALLLQEGEKPSGGGEPGRSAIRSAAASAKSGKPEGDETNAADAKSDKPATKEPKKTAEQGQEEVSKLERAGDEVSAEIQDGRVKASPLAKKIARELGVDLKSVAGSGPGSRILRDDVLEAAKTAQKGPKVRPQPVPAKELGVAAAAEDRRIPMSGMRKAIATRLLEAKTTIPHFYLQAEIDAGPMVNLRREINASLESAGLGKITVNDFILKATAVAATRVPQANAAFAGDAVIQFANVQLACAVAIEDGLVTPVIREAQKKSLSQISTDIKDLANRARSKKLKPEEYQGGTITVSNLGGYGVEQFFAIINPPQSVIVSVGTIIQKPVVNAAGQIVVGQRIILGISCDHRVVDGAIGAQFLAELKKLLENPALMLI
ncbi:MAG: pyruvate dehydrogenase complex dihydrolipoamide acetyltransferase [Chthoniobacterales bacterium]